MRIYLKKLTSINVPMKLTYQGYKGQSPATDFQTKQEIPGKFQYLHIFSNAQYPEICFYANEYEHKDLETFKPLDRVTVCKMEKKREGKPSYFNYVFAAEGDAMESVVSEPPRMTPTQERKLESTVDAMAVKNAAISLQGFAQQILPVIVSSELMNVAANPREIIQQSFDLAELAYKENLKRAKALVSDLGFDSL